MTTVGRSVEGPNLGLLGAFFGALLALFVSTIVGIVGIIVAVIGGAIGGAITQLSGSLATTAMQGALTLTQEDRYFALW